MILSPRSILRTFSFQAVRVFRSAGLDGSEGRFRSSEGAVKQRSALQFRVPLHTPSHGGKKY